MNNSNDFFNHFSQLVLAPYLIGQQQIKLSMENYINWLNLMSPSHIQLRTIDTSYFALEAPTLQVVPDLPQAIAAPVQTEDTAPLKLTVMGTEDDLTAINGIGPGIAGKLNKRGITTFAQVAAWTDSEVEILEAEIIRFSGRISREDWIGQAKTLTNLQ